MSVVNFQPQSDLKRPRAIRPGSLFLIGADGFFVSESYRRAAVGAFGFVTGRIFTSLFAVV
jgi:hypothetical protein